VPYSDAHQPGECLKRVIKSARVATLWVTPIDIVVTVDVLVARSGKQVR
jgi:hypothetical protein